VLNSGNAEVPTTSQTDPWWAGGQLLVPNAALAEGTGYHLSYAETCAEGATPGDVSRAFDVGAASPFPSTLGALHGAHRVVGPRSVVTSKGSCVSSIRAVAIDVLVTPSAELRAYAGVTGFNVSVDGSPAASIYYGDAKLDAEGLLVTTLYAACDARDPADLNGPALGVHTIGVRAHRAGALTDPPEITGQWRFSCTDATVEVDAADAGADGGAGGGGAGGGGSGGGAGGGADGGATGPASADNSGCACASAGRTSDASTPAFLVAGMLVALGVKRRKDLSRKAR
jgi:MYXO-CTERM domain-containing protein